MPSEFPSYQEPINAGSVGAVLIDYGSVGSLAFWPQRSRAILDCIGIGSISNRRDCRCTFSIQSIGRSSVDACSWGDCGRCALVVKKIYPFKFVDLY